MWWEQQPNGKYKFKERYTNPLTGKTQKVSVSLEKDTKSCQKQAQAVLSEKIDNIIKELLKSATEEQPKTNYTVSDLVKGYLEEQKRTVKGSTYRRNSFTANSLLNALGPDVLLTKITASYVREKWMGSGGANSTLNGRLKRWKGILRWGYQNDYIEDIRFLEKLRPLPDISYREKIEDKFLETDEFLKLIVGMEVRKWKLLTRFLGLSGIRIGEAIALNNSDIDFGSRIIQIAETYDSNNNIRTSPKSQAAYRDVYMQDELYDCAKEINIYMLRQRLISGYPKSDLFFQDEKDGGPIKYYAYNKYIKENGLRILDREKVTPHILRHTHTCILAENGVSLETITRRLGHEDSDITKKVYLHVTKKMKQHDNEQVAAIKIM